MPAKGKYGHEHVNIRPGVSILSVLRHLNYKPWYALAEFIDNSIQSHLASEAKYRLLLGEVPQLRVTIDWESDGNRIVIHDNAGGIKWADFPRAFRPAALPPDRNGLNEFGMGMKSAACWFASNWSVTTTALGDSAIRKVSFDIEKIVSDTLNELEVQSESTKPDAHFTEVVLENIHPNRHWKTLAKIEEHLKSIYRVFLTDGTLVLTLNGQVLQYNEPETLIAPHHRDQDDPSAPSYEWRKDISFDFGLGQSVFGFAALLEKGSTSHAGLALFRRGRLILGSGDETYRPREIFGAGNDYRYQRLFGELHLEGFEVSHTKDGFQWESDEEAVFLQLLKEELKKPPLNLLDQAEGYRSRPRLLDIARPATRATERTAEVVQNDLPPILELSTKSAVEPDRPHEVLEESPLAASAHVEVYFDGRSWRILIECSTEEGVGDWISIAEQPTARFGPTEVRIRLSLSHPFSVRYMGANGGSIEVLERFAVALALAEITARESGVRGAPTVRRNVNELLKALARS